MPTKPSFTVKVLANHLTWPSLSQKLANIRAFYASVCDLQFTIIPTNLNPVFTTYPDVAPLKIVDKGWYGTNISQPHASDADIVMFIVAPQDRNGAVTPLGDMSQHNYGPWEITIYANGENDITEMQGQTLGNSFELYAEHELSHVFFPYCGNTTDLTHRYFPTIDPTMPFMGPPAAALAFFSFTSGYGALEWLKEKLTEAAAALNLIARKEVSQVVDAPQASQTAPPAQTTQTQTQTAAQPAPAAELRWDVKEDARHSIRVMCDNAGLSFADKQTITACIYQESRFDPKAEGKPNYDGSRDWGLVQINDSPKRGWIGPRCDFVSTQEVLDNPEKGVSIMIQCFKAGNLDWWDSYKYEAYKQWLPFVDTPCPPDGYHV